MNFITRIYYILDFVKIKKIIESFNTHIYLPMVIVNQNPNKKLKKILYFIIWINAYIPFYNFILKSNL